MSHPENSFVELISPQNTTPIPLSVDDFTFRLSYANCAILLGAVFASAYANKIRESRMKMDRRHLVSDQARRVEIRIQGQLDESWSDWLEGMEVGLDGNMTTLRGVVQDQAELRGILSRIWDISLSLISLNSIEIGSSDTIGREGNHE